jgi:NAD(P)-dependent dehydrogenase (short-subunit alcohol dehydrogenase family)
MKVATLPCARDTNQISEAVKALKSKGVSAFGGTVDITGGDALREWIEKAGSELGGLDVLISSAGGDGYRRRYQFLGKESPSGHIWCGQFNRGGLTDA